MKTIWKYPIPVTGDFNLDLPAGAEILTVHTQGGYPKIWALVNPDIKTENRKFIIKPTGYSYFDSKNMQYIGTFFLDDELTVWHLFEILKGDKMSANSIRIKVDGFLTHPKLRICSNRKCKFHSKDESLCKFRWIEIDDYGNCTQFEIIKEDENDSTKNERNTKQHS